MIVYCIFESLAGAVFLAGSACLALASIPKIYSNGQSKAKISDHVDNYVLLPGKLFISTGFSICYIITTELYPTNLRTQPVAICSLLV